MLDSEPAPTHLVGIVVALPCETRPWVARLGLERFDSGRVFETYRGEGFALVRTGIGKIRAAAGVAHLAAVLGASAPRSWINVGVAGHRDAPIGATFIAHKVSDAATRAAWYPPILGRRRTPTASVVSVDRLERDYPDDDLYDMEAAGFVPMAIAYTTAELVQVVKIVSDRRDDPPEELSAQRVECLVDGAFETIDRVISDLRDLAHEHARIDSEPPALRAIASTHRLSVTETRRLRDLLRRWSALDPSARPGPETWNVGTPARRLLEDAARRVEAAAAARIVEPGRCEETTWSE
jgi:adenosylhomocysteine nucleosidase